MHLAADIQAGHRILVATKKGRMAKNYSVTSAGISAAEDRAHRMRFYFTAMSLRMACVASLFFVRGWWVLVAGIGAVVLPYLAVMVANAVSSTDGEKPDAPAPLQLESSEPKRDEATEERASEAVIVVDADEYRRSTQQDSERHESAPEDSPQQESTRETPSSGEKGRPREDDA